MKLTERQIEYGFNYYFPEEDTAKSVVELSEYSGEKELTINCTQLGYWLEENGKKQKDAKRIINEWCDFLTNNPNAFEKLSFGTRVPQELFDAVCCQKNLTDLYLKWGAYKDLSKIENLSKLEFLHIGSGASVESIKPLFTLTNLVAIAIENFQKITDYSGFAQMNNLQSLSIDGDTNSPKNIKMKSLEFLRKMPQLKCFRLLLTVLESKDYTPILDLKNLEYLAIGRKRIVTKLDDKFAQMPKLKYGWGWKPMEN